MTDTNKPETSSNDSLSLNQGAIDPNREHVDASYRIPKLCNFFRNEPALWFAQTELLFDYARLTSERARAGAIMAALDCDVIQVIGDLIVSADPIPDLYTQIKKRLIENFSSSPESELRSILKGEIIGDGKPSAILNRIRHLSRNRCSDEVIRVIFLEHIPANCRAILALSETNDLTKLATIADKIVDAGPVYGESVSSIDNSGDIKDKLNELSQRLDSLSTRNFKSNGSYNRNRNRSRSRYRSDSNKSRDHRDNRSQSRNNKEKICFYHKKFNNNANKCRPPCSFVKSSSEN